jgi:hypothetical protein
VRKFLTERVYIAAYSSKGQNVSVTQLTPMDTVQDNKCAVVHLSFWKTATADWYSLSVFYFVGVGLCNANQHQQNKIGGSSNTLSINLSSIKYLIGCASVLVERKFLRWSKENSSDEAWMSWAWTGASYVTVYCVEYRYRVQLSSKVQHSSYTSIFDLFCKPLNSQFL